MSEPQVSGSTSNPFVHRIPAYESIQRREPPPASSDSTALSTQRVGTAAMRVPSLYLSMNSICGSEEGTSGDLHVEFPVAIVLPANLCPYCISHVMEKVARLDDTWRSIAVSVLGNGVEGIEVVHDNGAVARPMVVGVAEVLVRIGSLPLCREEGKVKVLGEVEPRHSQRRHVMEWGWAAPRTQQAPALPRR